LHVRHLSNVPRLLGKQFRNADVTPALDHAVDLILRKADDHRGAEARNAGDVVELAHDAAERTGGIVFTLTGPDGATVDSERVTVNGDGIYTTPTGFTLPTSGAATGTYRGTPPITVTSTTTPPLLPARM
jgi:hypothetical protein